jgi:hypothetical protein
MASSRPLDQILRGRGLNAWDTGTHTVDIKFFGTARWARIQPRLTFPEPRAYLSISPPRTIDAVIRRYIPIGYQLR